MNAECPLQPGLQVVGVDARTSAHGLPHAGRCASIAVPPNSAGHRDECGGRGSTPWGPRFGRGCRTGPWPAGPCSCPAPSRRRREGRGDRRRRRVHPVPAGQVAPSRPRMVISVTDAVARISRRTRTGSVDFAAIDSDHWSRSSAVTSSGLLTEPFCPAPPTPAARPALGGPLTMARYRHETSHGPGGHGDAHSARRHVAGRKYGAGAARPWPSVETPTVRIDRPDGPDAVRYRPWTPRHVDSQ